MKIREITRDEVAAIWQIDRGELIDHIYYFRDDRLVLEAEHYDMSGWPPGEAETYNPILLDCFDRGGTFYGAFTDVKMVGVSVLESEFIGSGGDQLQLKFLHVDRSERGTGLGRTLFATAAARAASRGATSLYISATPSHNTVDFYRHLGCRLAKAVNSKLFELEPDDIHLDYLIPG